MIRLTLALALALAAACTSDPARDSYGMAGTAANPALFPKAAPPMEPQRKVSEQDCSRPVDLSAGNLRCR
jgi:hypothetical protein